MFVGLESGGKASSATSDTGHDAEIAMRRGARADGEFSLVRATGRHMKSCHSVKPVFNSEMHSAAQ